MSKKDFASRVPKDILAALAQADKAKGFPEGTMLNLMQQEIGGQLEAFMAQPDKFHYAMNAQGKRIAGHTGKSSDARGAFGILSSTARNPGYGVAPLKNWSLAEQIRFSSDYLAARTKHAGGKLSAGLAGYGEGTKYANQVMGRIGGGVAQMASLGKGYTPLDTMINNVASGADARTGNLTQASQPTPELFDPRAAAQEAWNAYDAVVAARKMAEQAAAPSPQTPQEAVAKDSLGFSLPTLAMPSEQAVQPSNQSNQYNGFAPWHAFKAFTGWGRG